MPLEFQEYIEQMTLEEKASLLSGANFWNTKAIKRLGIPSIMLTDGPHGLRKQAGKADHLGLSNSVPATCFPTAAALAQTWDQALVEKVGFAIGNEAASNEVGALLGPGLNIVRDPLAGRAFEYFSEDPYVAGKLAASMVRGIQQNGIAATPKHFAVNSQEHMRMSIDEVVDERTMREIYLEGFRRVVQEANPHLMMTSYNKVNGVYANENKHLLTDILYKEWGYQGALVTDWGGNNDPVAAVIAGGALEMPSTGGISDKVLIEAVKVGTLSEAALDVRVNTILGLTFSAFKATKKAQPSDYNAHHELAVEAARNSLVLLKNDGIILPLHSDAKIAIIGDFAKIPRYQGAGSSLVNPTRLVSAFDEISKEQSIRIVGYEPGFNRAGKKNDGLAKKAAALAKKAETTIVFLGLDESKEAEGIDRKTMQLPLNQLALLKELVAVTDKIVVVLAAGGPIEMPFADNVSAILHGSLGGQGLGEAILDVLVGRHNPSGKLAVSYPYVYSDAPTANYFPGKEATAEHREGLYVGYRYYETSDVAVRYPFGFGLSYTQFEYSNLVVSAEGVTVSIKNSGVVAGAEVVQLYIKPPKTAIYRPTRELKGFAKVFLQPGETQQASIAFDEHTFAHYSVESSGWVVSRGEYGIEVGSSVRDIRASQVVSVQGIEEGVAGTASSYQSGMVQQVSDAEFEQLLGRPLPPALWDRTKKVTYSDTVLQLQYGPLPGRIFYGLLKLTQKMLFALKKPYLANNVVFVMNLPISKIPGFSGGKISEKAIKRFLWIK